MDEDIIGYHGTKKELVESICTENFIINDDKDNKLFLGYGIYFFYSCDDALDWNVKCFIKKFSNLPNWEMLLSNYAIILNIKGGILK